MRQLFKNSDRQQQQKLPYSPVLTIKHRAMRCSTMDLPCSSSSAGVFASTIELSHSGLIHSSV